VEDGHRRSLPENSERDIPDTLKDKRVLALDLGALLAGPNTGANSRTVKAVLNEIDEAAGSVILFIDELHTIVVPAPRKGQWMRRI